VIILEANHIATKPALEPVEAPADVIFELPGDIPKCPEADGRQVTEKEAIRIREERYNGVDAAATTSPISPMTPGSQTSNSNDNTISSVITDGSNNNSKKGKRRKLLGAGDVVPYREGMTRPQISSEGNSPVETRGGSDRVSPVDGSGSEGTGTLSGLISPMVPTRRFSWQE
jgi:hypothetical protein